MELIDKQLDKLQAYLDLELQKKEDFFFSNGSRDPRYGIGWSQVVFLSDGRTPTRPSVSVLWQNRPRKRKTLPWGPDVSSAISAVVLENVIF